MKYCTVGTLVEALQKMPQDAPVFAYSEMEECDARVEYVELYTPDRKDKQEYEKSLKNEECWPGYIYPPHGCKGDSNVSIFWQEHGLQPVVYIRESLWGDRHNERKEDTICLLTADM